MRTRVYGTAYNNYEANDQYDWNGTMHTLRTHSLAQTAVANFYVEGIWYKSLSVCVCASIR